MLSRHPLTAIAIAVVAFAADAALAQGTISVDPTTVRIGYPFGIGSGGEVRLGRWTPIRLEIQAAGSAHREVELVVRGVDADGDHVAYTLPTVTLTAGAGPRPVWTYVPVGNTWAEVTQVEIIPATGAPVVMPLPHAQISHDGDRHILDISRQPLPAAFIEGLRRRADGGNGRPYLGRWRLAHDTSTALPDRWIGLDMLDVVVWDRPDPAAEGVSTAQLDALCTWVRNGGELLVGLGLRGETIADTQLADILPVTILSGTDTTQRLARFERRFAREEDRRADAPPRTLARVELRPGAYATFVEQVHNRDVPLITSWNIGSGRVTVVACSLSELLAGRSAPTEPRAIRALLSLTPVSEEYLVNETRAIDPYLKDAPLFEGLVSPTNFGALGASFVTIALVFAALYALVATFGVAWLLRRRGQLGWSWPAFAAVAGVTSILSLGAVHATSWWRGGLQSSTLVDLTANSIDARAWCWFGHSSTEAAPTDFTITADARLAEETASAHVRPLAAIGQRSTFQTPQRYTCDVRRGTLRDVPQRPTLKQYQGFWEGRLQGSIQARLIADRTSGQITNTSWINNLLGADISGGYLLYVDPRRSAVLPDPARLTDGGATDDRPPAEHVLVAEIPAIPSGTRITDAIGRREYAELRRAQTEYDRLDPQRRGNRPRPDLPSLLLRHQEWTGLSGLRYLGTPAPAGFQNTAFVASTCEMLYGTAADDLDAFSNRPSPRGLPDCDVTHWLAEDQAILILFADRPGPATLERAGQPLRAGAGQTCYRVRVPLGYVGSPPPRSTP